MPGSGHRCIETAGIGSLLAVRYIQAFVDLVGKFFRKGQLGDSIYNRSECTVMRQPHEGEDPKYVEC